MDSFEWPADLLPDDAGVLGADDDPGRITRGLCSPRRELGAAPHRVLELGSVREDGVARARGRSDRTAQDQVPGDDEVGGQVLADRSRIRLDPGVELAPAGLLHALHAVALVA